MNRRIGQTSWFQVPGDRRTDALSSCSERNPSMHKPRWATKVVHRKRVESRKAGGRTHPSRAPTTPLVSVSISGICCKGISGESSGFRVQGGGVPLSYCVCGPVIVRVSAQRAKLRGSWASSGWFWQFLGWRALLVGGVLLLSFLLHRFHRLHRLHVISKFVVIVRGWRIVGTRVGQQGVRFADIALWFGGRRTANERRWALMLLRRGTKKRTVVWERWLCMVRHRSNGSR